MCLCVLWCPLSLPPISSSMQPVKVLAESRWESPFFPNKANECSLLHVCSVFASAFCRHYCGHCQNGRRRERENGHLLNGNAVRESEICVPTAAIKSSATIRVAMCVCVLLCPVDMGQLAFVPNVSVCVCFPFFLLSSCLSEMCLDTCKSKTTPSEW